MSVYDEIAVEADTEAQAEKLRKRKSARTLQEKRKAQGICVYCGKNAAVPGRVACSECAEERKQYSKAVFALRESVGLCKTCGKAKAMNGKKYCRKCLINSSQRVLKSHKKKQSEGKCAICGKLLSGEKKTCENCLAKKRESNRQKAIRAKENNLCPMCLSPKTADDGYSFCERCRTYKRIYQARYKKEHIKSKGE